MCKLFDSTRRCICMSPMILQIKELLSRNLDAVEISHRLHVPIEIVRQAIDLLS
jgi:hypothetical protein